MDQTETRHLLAQIQDLLAGVAGAEGDEARQILERAQAQPGDTPRLALALAGKRALGAPLALVLGRQTFLGVDLLAREDVLAPRAETELLGREVITLLRGLALAEPGRELRMIDMGCGAGNLACCVAMAIPQARIWASDLTAACAELTRVNAARLALQDRIQVSQGDLFAPLRNRGLEATLDLVVMNPPYIPSASLARTHAGLLDHEPREAFDGGPYGISILSRLMQDAPAFLKPGGALLCEFGLGQDRLVQTLAERQSAWSQCRFVSNAAGAARVAVLRMAPAREREPLRLPD
jgi:release factor glutamine methyltransferase